MTASDSRKALAEKLISKNETLLNVLWALLDAAGIGNPNATLGEAVRCSVNWGDGCVSSAEVEYIFGKLLGYEVETIGNTSYIRL